MRLYAVVKADGTIRRAGAAGTGRIAIYETEAKARNRARADGDSVVELAVFMATYDEELTCHKPPVFIKSKRLGSDGA